MTPTTPAFAPGTLTQLARGKTRKVQHKLKVAEDQLREANSALEALPEELIREVGAALSQASHAEHQVREAEAELEVVTQLLTIEALPPQAGSATPAQGSGEGTRGLLPRIGPEDPGQR